MRKRKARLPASRFSLWCSNSKPNSSNTTYPTRTGTGPARTLAGTPSRTKASTSRGRRLFEASKGPEVRAGVISTMGSFPAEARQLRDHRSDSRRDLRPSDDDANAGVGEERGVLSPGEKIGRAGGRFALLARWCIGRHAIDFLSPARSPCR